MTRPRLILAEYARLTRPSPHRFEASSRRACATVLFFTLGTTQRAWVGGRTGGGGGWRRRRWDEPRRRSVSRPGPRDGPVDRVVTCRAKSSSVAWASLAPSSRSRQAISDASCRPCRPPSRLTTLPGAPGPYRGKRLSVGGFLLGGWRGHSNLLESSATSATARSTPTRSSRTDTSRTAASCAEPTGSRWRSTASGRSSSATGTAQHPLLHRRTRRRESRALRLDHGRLAPKRGGALRKTRRRGCFGEAQPFRGSGYPGSSRSSAESGSASRLVSARGQGGRRGA
jgi:hypothetical protein